MNRERYLQEIDAVNAAGKYHPTWESLSTHPVPDWYREKRLGIFLHWGVFSVPAYHDWYARNMYIKGSPEYEYHCQHYGQPKDFGFKDFIPQFKMEAFDPQAWVKLFREAGADYIVPVAEHHDGFQNYRSELSHWNAAEMGPHRDIMGDLLVEAERAGMTLGASSHRVEHWWFLGHEFDSDIKQPMHLGDYAWPAMPERENQDLFSEPMPTDEFLTDWLLRCCEIVDRYHPRILYFDWWIQHEAFHPYLKKLAAFYYNCGKSWGEDVMICYKHDAMMFGSGIVEVERGGFAEAKPYAWQTDTAVARNSWCYTDSLDYKSSREILCTLVDVVSKNGNLLLNIGPKADGTIPEGDRQILSDMASWMKVNGEAVRGAKVWRKSMEGPTRAVDGQFADAAEIMYTPEDYRFTVNGGCIYAICMRCPRDGRFLIRSFAKSTNQNLPEFHGILRAVTLLGYVGQAAWHVDREGLHIAAPGIESDFPVVFRLEVD